MKNKLSIKRMSENLLSIDSDFKFTQSTNEYKILKSMRTVRSHQQLNLLS